jgi:hypothetical protein
MGLHSCEPIHVSISASQPVQASLFSMGAPFLDALSALLNGFQNPPRDPAAAQELMPQAIVVFKLAAHELKNFSTADQQEVIRQVSEKLSMRLGSQVVVDRGVSS